MINQAWTEYRKLLTRLVEAGNRACKTGDAAEVARIRAEIPGMLPDPSFAEDIRAQMTTCAKAGCLQMNASLVMARLKTRVNPELSPALRDFVRGPEVTVRVKGRIDEGGNMSVTEAEGIHPSVNSAVRTAVEQWKFSPIIDQNGPRCVETEIPIVLRFSR